MIVGVTGYATSGKDEVANVLVDEFGFQKLSWAESIRRDLAVLDPIVGQIRSKFLRRKWDVTFSEVLEHFGYVEGKATFPEFRRLMQSYGTDVHRVIDEDYWVTRTLSSIVPGSKVVIPDVRFPNEAAAVDFLILVERPGVGPVNDHPSDAGLAFPFANVRILNDGSLEDLAGMVRTVVESTLWLSAD